MQRKCLHAVHHGFNFSLGKVVIGAINNFKRKVFEHIKVAMTAEASVDQTAGGNQSYLAHYKCNNFLHLQQFRNSD